MLRAMRFRHWAHFLLLPLASWEPSGEWTTGALALGRGILIAFFILAFGYLINGVSDRGLDSAPEKNPLIGHTPGARLSWMLAGLATAALLLGASAPRPVFIGTVTGLTSGVLYSTGLRLKRFPVVGTALNVSNFAPLLFLGAATEDIAPWTLALGVAFTLLILQNQLLHEAADRLDDERGGVHTSAFCLGPVGTSAVVAALGVALTAFLHRSAAVPPMFAILCALVFGLAFPIVVFRAGLSPSAMANARIIHRYASAVAGATFFAWIRFG